MGKIEITNEQLAELGKISEQQYPRELTLLLDRVYAGNGTAAEKMLAEGYKQQYPAAVVVFMAAYYRSQATE